MKKSLRRLTLHNFQSHQDTTLDLSSGVNIIVGASDVGKTSVIRALRWLYYNQPRGTGFIRMGTSECWVEVETEDQVIIRRYRNEATRKNGYLLVPPGQDPMIFEKLGTAVPEEVKQALGVEEMVIDQDVVMNLNIAYQLDGAFLLENPGTTRAKAIGRLGDAHIVDAAQREIQRDLRALGQEIEKKKSQFAEEEKLLLNYQHLPDWESRLQKIDQLFNLQAEKQIQQNLLAELANKYGQKKDKQQQLAAALAVLDGVTESEDIFTRLSNLAYSEGLLTALIQQHEIKNRNYQACNQILEQTGTLSDAQTIGEKIRKLAELAVRFGELKKKLEVNKADLEQINATIAATENLELAADIYLNANEKKNDVAALMQIHHDFTVKQSRLTKAEQQLDATAVLDAAEKTLQKLGDLRTQGANMYEQWRSYQQRYEQWQQTKSKLNLLQDFAAAEGKLAELLRISESLPVMTEYQKRYQETRSALGNNQERLIKLQSDYRYNTEQYLDCLKSVGECPVCHGSIDDNHLKELKAQLEEEWMDEQ